MLAGRRTRRKMTRKEMQLNRRWVPRPGSPEDDKFHKGLPDNAVVRPRSDPGRRSADPPRGTSVQAMGAHRGLRNRPRSPQSMVKGTFQNLVHRSEPDRSQNPLTLMRRTQNPLGEQTRQPHRDRLYRKPGTQGWGEGSKDDPKGKQ